MIPDWALIDHDKCETFPNRALMEHDKYKMFPDRTPVGITSRRCSLIGLL